MDEATGHINELPPSLKENIDELKKEAVEVKSVETGEPKKRGRPKGSRNKGKEEVPSAPIIDFPIEALALAHYEIWNYLAKRLKSEYKLSDKGANEMALYASLCLKQYLGPYLAQHQALACYLLTQVTATAALFVMRPPKQKEQELTEVKQEQIS